MHAQELLHQGIDLVRKGDQKRGTALIAKAVQMDPSLTQGWWALAHLLEDPEKQAQCLRQVLNLEPDHARARARLVELQTAQASGLPSPDAKSPDRSFESVYSYSSEPELSGTEMPGEKEEAGVRSDDTPTSRRKKWPLYFGAAIVIVLLGAGFALLFTRGEIPDAFRTLFGESGGEEGIVAVPTLPPEWAPTSALGILVPTGTATATATEPPPPSSATATSTLAPSKTPTLRYTLTATSTFNPQNVPTVTPGSAAVCPELASPGGLTLTEPYEDIYASGEEVLEYLNAGGSFTEVERALEELSFRTEFQHVDLTNDRVPEIVMYSFAVYVFGCQDGEYVELLRIQPEIRDTMGMSMDFIVRDLNRDGVQNLLITTDNEGGENENFSLNVLPYEWDGEDFINLAPEEVHHPFTQLGIVDHVGGYQFSLYRGQMELRDVDLNGTIEIILKNDLYLTLGAGKNLPQREETDTWMWNGETYNLVDVELSPAVYKVHAVNDGDLAALEGDYPTALQSYQRAIDDPSLEIWNDARWDWSDFGYAPDQPKPTYPPPDPAHGAQVEAYARYRILLTNLLLDQVDEAKRQYPLIIDKHPLEDPGHTMAQMAVAFYEAYETTGIISGGCEAARTFAERHENEVLDPINFGFFGGTTISYEPEDICPY